MILLTGCGIMMLQNMTADDISTLVLALCCILTGALLLAYFLTYDVKRNKFKQNGECIPGRIIGAQEVVSRRGVTYYLLIAFNDNGTKIRYTEGYKGDPNLKLRSRDCNIYKLNGKYIEADFQALGKDEWAQALNIPVEKTLFPPLFPHSKDSGYV